MVHFVLSREIIFTVLVRLFQKANPMHNEVAIRYVRLGVGKRWPDASGRWMVPNSNKTYLLEVAPKEYIGCSAYR
jgi:hypothetical protein